MALVIQYYSVAAFAAAGRRLPLKTSAVADH